MEREQVRKGRSEGWKHRIGGDTWKNVITLECEALKSIKDEIPPPNLVEVSLPYPQLPNKLIETPWAYEVVRGSGDPRTRSFVVWQTGRLFVVGPTMGAAKRLQGVDRRCRHINIVLLSWNPRHYDGINEILGRYRENVTIWTSYWLWEEITRKLKPERTFKVFAPWIENQAPEKPAVALFERKGVWHPTSGVSLAMSYSVSVEPFLNVEFRCNNRKIVIDPAVDAVGLSPKHVLDDIRDRLMSGWKDEPETYNDQALERLHDTFGRYATKGVGESIGWSLSVCDGVGFNRPVDLDPASKRFSILPQRVRFPKLVTQKAVKHAIADGRADILQKSAIVILCGGVTQKADQELIDPGYGLDIGTGEDTERTPILEWRLRRLNTWSKRERVNPLPVILLTTPETEEIVRSCRERYEKYQIRIEDPNRLAITEAAAQLIPTKNQYGKNSVDRDGGWRLSPRGHMDALRLLAELRAVKRSPLEGKDFAIVLAFNNLGNIIGNETKKNLQILAADQDKQLFWFSVKLRREEAAEGEDSALRAGIFKA